MAGGFFLDSLHDPVLPLNIEASCKADTLNLGLAVLSAVKEFPALDTSALQICRSITSSLSSWLLFSFCVAPASTWLLQYAARSQESLKSVIFPPPRTL